MTIINGIEIDIIRQEKNETKSAIQNNSPIEKKLHVIAVISNPCLFAKRYILMREFIHRIEKEEDNVELYIVELAYGKQRFLITDEKNKNHLQLRTECPLWHKENMINLAVQRLLPKNYKAFAWVDADVEFESTTWAMDALRILNGSKDIVQLFSHCCDMAENETSMSVFNSAGYQYMKKNRYINNGINYSHPGFAWAMTRNAYEKMGGLYELGILGAGDFIMLLSLFNDVDKYIEKYNDGYKTSVLEFQKKIKSLRFGYVPGVIRHYFHGSKKNRKYKERYQILLDHDYNPQVHVTRGKNGVLVPTEKFSQEFKSDIYAYFKDRNEDE